MKYFLFEKELNNIHLILFLFENRHETWNAKPTLPLIDLPWQHSNASQSVWIFVSRKAVFIWHKHVMDNPPATTNAPPNAPAQLLPYLSMYMLNIDASTDMTYEPYKPKATIILTFFDFSLSSWEAYFFWRVNIL